ncbi:MAG: MscS family membrane protein [Cyclobacteriaceae bacterium]|jgi:small-conductance mechanosensitive channel
MSETVIKQITITGGITILYFILRIIISRFNKRYALKNKIREDRVVQTNKIINFVLTFIFIIIIAIAWEFEFEKVFTYMLTLLTVIGIGLFAQWSILSNITASVILFFYFPYRIGGKVKIIDGDNSIIGTVKNISLFSIKIQNEEGQIISYPNNLAIQKPIVLLEDVD